MNKAIPNREEIRRLARKRAAKAKKEDGSSESARKRARLQSSTSSSDLPPSTTKEQTSVTFSRKAPFFSILVNVHFIKKKINKKKINKSSYFHAFDELSISNSQIFLLTRKLKEINIYGLIFVWFYLVCSK